MKQWTYIIQDTMGIHARPAGLLVKEAAKFPCAVLLEKEEKSVDAKRILGVMSLGAKCGDQVTLRCDGEGEEEALEALKKFFQETL